MGVQPRVLAQDQGRSTGDVRRRHRGTLAVTVAVSRCRAQDRLPRGSEIDRVCPVVREARELVLLVGGGDRDDTWTVVVRRVEVTFVVVVAQVVVESITRSSGKEVPGLVSLYYGVSQRLREAATTIVVPAVTVVADFGPLGDRVVESLHRTRDCALAVVHELEWHDLRSPIDACYADAVAWYLIGVRPDVVAKIRVVYIDTGVYDG